MENKLVPMSVVIPTLNRHETLKQTVASLCSGKCVPSQIIIVDQSAAPIDANVFGGLNGAKVLIHHPAAASSAAARNIGIRSAAEEIILFCDDDILLNVDSISKLYEIVSDDYMALVAAIHYADNAVYTPTAKLHGLKDFAGTILGMKKFWRRDGYVIKCNMRGRYAPNIREQTGTEWAMGYFFCIKKRVIQNMDHGFDEHLIRYAYAEDLDFTYRYCCQANQMGLRTIVAPEIYVNHLASREWRVPKQEETNYLFANRRYLSYKLFPQRNWYRAAMDVFDRLYWITQLNKREYAREIRNSLKLCKANKQLIKEGRIAELAEKSGA